MTHQMSHYIIFLKDVSIISNKFQLKNPQVKIQTKYAAVNFGDILRLKGQYQEKAELPFIPGSIMAAVLQIATLSLSSSSTSLEIFQ